MRNQKISIKKNVYVLMYGITSIFLLHANFTSTADRKALIKKPNAGQKTPGTSLAILASCLANFGSRIPTYTDTSQTCRQCCRECGPCIGKTCSALCCCELWLDTCCPYGWNGNRNKNWREDARKLGLNV